MKHKTETQIEIAAISIARDLDGFPVGQALFALERARLLLLDSVIFDTSSERFTEHESEASKLGSLSDESL